MLQEAVALAKSGDRAGATRIVAQVLQSDPSSADAWIVMSQLVDDEAKAIDCLNRALALRPGDARIQQALERKYAPPAQLRAIPQPSVAVVEAAPKRVIQETRNGRTGLWIVLTSGAAILFLCLAGIFFTAPGQYIADMAINPCHSYWRAKTYIDLMDAQETKFTDAESVASMTSRIALAGPISELQSIARETETLEVPDCFQPTLTKEVVWMHLSISSFLSFMANDSDAYVQSLSESALQARFDFHDEMNVAQFGAQIVADVKHSLTSTVAALTATSPTKADAFSVPTSIKLPTNTPRPVVTSAPTRTPRPTATPELGTRTNPIAIGDPVQIPGYGTMLVSGSEWSPGMTGVAIIVIDFFCERPSDQSCSVLDFLLDAIGGSGTTYIQEFSGSVPLPGFWDPMTADVFGGGEKQGYAGFLITQYEDTLVMRVNAGFNQFILFFNITP
jgi:hypothetical protein